MQGEGVFYEKQLNFGPACIYLQPFAYIMHQHTFRSHSQTSWHDGQIQRIKQGINIYWSLTLLGPVLSTLHTLFCLYFRDKKLKLGGLIFCCVAQGHKTGKDRGWDLNKVWPFLQSIPSLFCYLWALFFLKIGWVLIYMHLSPPSSHQG
jgi:hypothetical protein